MATVEQLEEGLRRAYEAGMMEEARIIGEELVKARGGETTAGGVLGAAARGLSLPAAGAVAGGLMGAPIAGVGAVPGAIAGAGAATLAGMVADPIVASINNLFGTQYTLPTDALKDLLTRIGVPNPDTEAERIVETTTMAAGGAGGAAAAGRAVQAAAGPGVTREVGRTLAAQPGVQVAGGAGAGLAGQIAAEEGLFPEAQLGASLVGGLAAGRLAAPRTAVTVPRAEMQLAERAGIPVMTSDVMPPTTFASRWLQSMGEKVPFVGTGPVRQQQQLSRVDAVKDVLRQYGADDVSQLSDDVMRDLSRTKSQLLTRYVNQKEEVINKLADRGVLPMSRTMTAIDDEIARLKGLRTKEVEPIISRLEDWKNAIPNQNIRNVEVLRKQIGESFKAPELAGIRSTGEKSLSSIYGPLKRDMEDFIMAVGDRRDATKWKVANSRLAESASDLRVASLKTLLTRGDATPEVIQNILFKGKPSEIRSLYSKLSPEGRATARMAIIAKAGKDAEIDFAGQASVSPDRFATSLKKMGNSVGVFFKESELDQVKGLVKVLNMTKRAGEASVTPPTGQMAVPFIAVDVLSASVGGPMGATAVAAGTGGLARIYESKPVRDLLIKIGRTRVGSKEEAELAKRLIPIIQSQAEQIQEVGRSMVGEGQ
jgi:hypothetical protein